MLSDSAGRCAHALLCKSGKTTQMVMTQLVTACVACRKHYVERSDDGGRMSTMRPSGRGP